jgi:hypothetical protein
VTVGQLFKSCPTIGYTSGWYTVVLPTAITLLVWAGIFLIPLALMGWTVPDWLGMLLCFGGFIPGLAVAVLTYGPLLRLAERGRGELVLEGDRLRRRKGRQWREIDFAQPHQARIAAGLSGLSQPSASVTLYPSVEQIHLRGARRKDILRLFPEPWFVDERAPLPEEGTWGFDLSAEDPEAVRFFTALLECLWRNRENNERFRIYQRFPWHRRPQPAFRHIRHIPWDRRTTEDEMLLADLESRFVDGLTDSAVRATPDDLVGWTYLSPRSLLLDGRPDYYLMPLGYVTAETSITRSDGICSLFMEGVDEDGAPLKLTFDWYGAEAEGYEEAEFLVRFVQAMREKAARGGG